MIPRYPGAKAGAGVAERIISMMPRHDRYIEPFVGGGHIIGRKRPAPVNIAADIDTAVIAEHMRAPLPDVEYRVTDAKKLLASLELSRRDLVYMDPPYHPATRSGRRLYNFEMDELDHLELLSLALTLKASVMISGYRCALYDRMLASWHREDFRTMTRGGVRIESVWCNFVPGESFHDTRWLGKNFRERERIKRKRLRWVSRFLTMAAEDRAVVWEALEEAATAMGPATSPTMAGRTA